MPVTPVGLLAEPLNDVKTVILRSVKWQAWAGADFAKRVHLNANRIHIEAPDGIELYISDGMDMPFIVLWLSGWKLPVRGPAHGHITSQITFFVQDQAVDRHAHDESANTFLTNCGGLMADLYQDFRQQTQVAANQGTPAVTDIVMINEPARTNALMGQNIENDVWTSTFGLQLIGGVE